MGSNAFGGSDPAITLAVDGIVLVAGAVLSILLWVVMCVGFRNFMLLLFLAVMTPPSLTAAKIPGPAAAETLDESAMREGSGGMISKIIHNVVGLFERVPDEEEIVHRKIADAQILLPPLVSTQIDVCSDGIKRGAEEV